MINIFFNQSCSSWFFLGTLLLFISLLSRFAVVKSVQVRKLFDSVYHFVFWNEFCSAHLESCFAKFKFWFLFHFLLRSNKCVHLHIHALAAHHVHLTELHVHLTLIITKLVWVTHLRSKTHVHWHVKILLISKLRHLVELLVLVELIHLMLLAIECVLVLVIIII